VNDPLTEDERLAALADGRLGERERAEMLARLTADDDAYEVFAGLAAILRQAEAEEAAAGPVAADGGELVHAGAAAPVDAGVISLEERARARADFPPSDEGGRGSTKRVWHPGWLALAAVLVGVLVAGAVLKARTSAAREPVRLAARLEHAGEGLPAGWRGRRPWSSTRGDDAAGGASAEEQAARAVRAGAMLVELAVAVQGRDTAETQLLASQVMERFDPRVGRGGALRKIFDGAGGPPDALQPLLREATDEVAKRVGRRDALQLGAWLEAARLAAATRDAAFFRDGPTRAMLDRAARLTASDRPARDAVEQVRRLLAGAGEPRWDALAVALDAALGKIASD
jgi:hypothetical protein